MTIKDVTILIITLLFFWSGMVIADIAAGDNFIFEGGSLGEEVLDFIRTGGLQTYTITVNSAGSFSVDQGEIYKFKIDSLGNINWAGSLVDGDFHLKTLLASTACSGGYAYGIDAGGWRCVEDCDGDCVEYVMVGDDLTCNYLTGDQSCEPCATCNGVSHACVEDDTDGRCPACKTCSGGNCVNITDYTQDIDGDYTCEATCKMCFFGSCVAADGFDPGEDCGTTGCSTGLCNADSACGYYNMGEGSCPTCQTCDGATTTSCVLIVSGQDDDGVNTCDDRCKGCVNGNCVYESGTDKYDSCPKIGCETGFCDNGTGACAKLTSGEGECGVCKVCNASGECTAIGFNEQDTEGVTRCAGTCHSCHYGVCGYATGATDPGSKCGTTGCWTGVCDNKGGCDFYSDGANHNCSNCYICLDNDSACDYAPRGFYDGGCGQCDSCNGSGSCEANTTYWGAETYGCTGSNKRCYSGSCKSCDFYDCPFSWWNDNYLYSDGCNGCAGQGGLACWHLSRSGTDGIPQDNESCSTICADHGAGNTVVNANWNDSSSCAVIDVLWGGGGGYTCTVSSSGYAPFFDGYGAIYGYYRSSTVSNNTGSAGANNYNSCVCQY